MKGQRSVVAGALLAMAFAAIWLTGCSSNNNSTSTGPTSTAAPQLVSVTPVNDATGVAPTDSITMAFNMPMDTASVRRAFHLAGGPKMQLWMDSLGTHMGMGGMGGMTGMTHMMQWLDTISYHGHFHWNRTLDSATFLPDSMHANSPQMMFLFGDVRGQNGRMMVMDTFTYGGYMQRFTTQ